MSTQPVVDERSRLEAVRRYDDVLDSPRDGSFERITALAARLFKVPIAIVTLVDQDRIWFRSRHGLDIDGIAREPGLCGSAIMQPGTYVVDDAALDPRTMANSLVAGEFGLRFYAAAPLTTVDGHNLGTLCIIDREPRTLSEEERATLADLAALVMVDLELRRHAMAAVADEADLRATSERLAAVLQSSLLPPVLPAIPGVDIAATYRPAHHGKVGGDFYDIFPLPRSTWALVIGDVCGKGPRAASVTAAARYAIRGAAIDRPSPSAVLHCLNDTLLLDPGFEDEDDRPFCTVVYARLRPHGRNFRLTVGCGGHPPQLILRRGGQVESAATPGTLVGAL
ncbi:MAG: PP2C family protein-serine/threonine phosphatase, partial [Acidimicrobiales bacterium]